MPNVTSGNDVFEMAMEMERTGKDFYEALAMGSDDGEVRVFCVQTSRDEAEHLAVFRQMRDRLAKSQKIQPVPSNDADGLAALAKEHIQPDASAVHKVAIGGNLKDALNMAMAMEQDAIKFYRGILACSPLLSQSIQQIVGEEMKHLSRLRVLSKMS